MRRAGAGTAVSLGKEGALIALLALLHAARRNSTEFFDLLLRVCLGTFGVSRVTGLIVLLLVMVAVVAIYN